MNDTIELLLRHRTIRKYTDAPVPDEHVASAVQAGQAAATSSAVQAYCLLEVSDASVRERLVPLTGGQTKVAEAPRFFIVCGDTRLHRLACAAEELEYDAKLEAFVVATIDASLFAQNMVIAFESMGYGICYVGGLRNDLEAVHQLLDFPPGVYPLFGLCVGVPAQNPLMRPRLPAEAIHFKDRFPTDEQLRTTVGDYDRRYGDYLEARGADRRGWTDGLRKMFVKPARAYLARFYRSQGADLD